MCLADARSVRRVTVPETHRIVFNLQARCTDGAAWLDLARRAEASGMAHLFVADHPGSTASPFVALAAAAAVTDTIRLGTYVANAGAWEPLLLAIEVATLDRISGGRALLGIGAGHTPSEWTDRSLTYPTAGERVDHLIAVATETRAWLDLRLEHPRPVQDRVPLLVGGNGRRVLEFARDHADIVGVTGLGATLADGHDHDTAWSIAEIDERLGLVRASVRPLAIDALVQIVHLTDDREAAAQRIGAAMGLDAAQLLTCPYAFIGAPEQIAAQVSAHHTRWGITSYTVREDALDAVAEVRRALA